MQREINRLAGLIESGKDEELESERNEEKDANLQSRLSPKEGKNKPEVNLAHVIADVFDTNIQVDRFHGEKDELSVQAWLERLKMIANTKNWTDEQTFKRAMIALGGPAFDAVNHNRSRITNLEKLTKFLNARFGVRSPRDWYLRKLSQIRQGTDTAAQFINRFEKLANNCEDALPGYFSDSLLMGFFKQALSKPYLLEVKRRKGIKTLDELIRVVREADSFLKERALESVTPIAGSQTRLSRMQDQIEELSKQIKQRTEPVSQVFNPQNNDNYKDRFCFMCKKSGHFANPSCLRKMQQNMVNGSNFGFRRPNNRFSTPRQQRFTCYRCFGNHRASECRARFPRNNNPELVPRCAICKKFGHFSKDHGRFQPPFPRESGFNRNRSQQGGANNRNSRWQPRSANRFRFGNPRGSVNTVDDFTKAAFAVASCDVSLQNNHAVRAVLDTGATRSLINAEFAHRLIEQGKIPELASVKDTLSLSGANGNELLIEGQVNLEVYFGTQSVTQSFVAVKGLCHLVLIGMDMLVNTGAKIDLETKNLHVTALDIKIPLHAVKRHVNSMVLPPSMLFTVQDVLLPSRTNRQVNVCCNAFDPLNSLTRTGFVRTYHSSFHGPRLFVTPGLTEIKEGCVSLTVCNNSEESTFIPAQTPVALFSAPCYVGRKENTTFVLEDQPASDINFDQTYNTDTSSEFYDEPERESVCNTFTDFVNHSYVSCVQMSEHTRHLDSITIKTENFTPTSTPKDAAPSSLTTEAGNNFRDCFDDSDLADFLPRNMAVTPIADID